MADRGSTSAFQTAIAASQNRPLHFIKVILDGGTTRLTDHVADFAWDDGSGDGSQTWYATGQLLDFSGLEETVTPQVSTVTFTLSGADQTFTALFLGNDYIDREIHIWKGLLDASSAIIADPIIIFKGRLDRPVIYEDPDSGTSTVSITAASHWVDFERRPGRHTNDAEQQAWFPGDRGLEYVDQVTNKEITWTGKGMTVKPSWFD